MDMVEENDAFYVVRKGDVVGIYKSLSDCQAQAGSWVDNPPISVFKGYGLSKEVEKHLVTHGLKDACYSLDAADIQNDLFRELVPCPFQQPFPFRGKLSEKGSLPAGLRQESKSFEVPSTTLPTYPETSHFKSESSIAAPKTISCPRTCSLEFDGAAKRNPGPAGAGAVLRALDGGAVYHLREGLGIATNNVAEYRALILGLKHALKEGFRNISVYGDSNLVCMQVQGLWNVKNQNLAVLCKEARELMDKFSVFTITHIPRAQNSDADAQANLAVDLRDGQVEADCPSLTTDQKIERIGAIRVIYPGDV